MKAKEGKAMTIEQRLKAFRTAKKLTQKAFADEIYLSVDAVSMMERGVMPVSPRTIETLCAKYKDLSREWLETGEGEMLLLPLDDDAELFAEMQKIPNSATLESLKAIARMYVGLTKEERRALDQMITDAVLATKKDPE